MAFGREGGGRLGGDGGIYASRQDSSCSSSNAPHWMKQLEEKYQRLHAKIVNQAAKFSNARFNAINNNVNHYRNFSYGGSHRNSITSKSSTEGVHSVLTKRGSSWSTSAALTSKRELSDDTDANNDSKRGLKTGTKRRSNADESSLQNRSVDPFLVPADYSKCSSNNAGGGDSALSGEKGKELIWCSAPPPHSSHAVNTQTGPARADGLAPSAGRSTQAELCDPVRATLAKTSAAIARLNSSPIKERPVRARRRDQGCPSGSRLQSTHRCRLGQQQLLPASQQTHEREESRFTESVYSTPAGTSTSGGGYNNFNNTVYCFDTEVSGGVSAQHTPRASKPTTRASSQALTRLSSANFVCVSRAHSLLREEDLENESRVNDAEKRESNVFFTKTTRDPFGSNLHRTSHNGYVIDRRCKENQKTSEDEYIDYEESDVEDYSYEDASEYSVDNDEDVFVDEGRSESDESLSQPSGMEVAKSKGRRHASRTMRPSVSRLGQKPHKSCPAYFWKSANPYADAEGEEEKEHGRILKLGDRTEKGQVTLRKNKKNNLRKRDRRSTKSHEVRKGNVNTSTVHSKDNNHNLTKDSPRADGNDDRKETQVVDESCNDTIDVDPNNHDTNGYHPPFKSRSDSKGTISPVQGTLLPLTARAVEEGRMRVFARMSLEARHAVDETLREMEREEEKGDKEKIVDKTADGDSLKHGNMEMESTWDVSVMNHTSGTRGPSRVLEGDMTDGGHNSDRARGGGNGDGKGGVRDLVADSQGSITSDTFQDDFYASGRFHNSNPNFLHTKHLQDVTHSPSSSIGANRRAPISGQRAGSRRLPHLSDLPTAQQTSSLPNPHARLPGIGSKPRLSLSYRETTFEITPPDFDIRFHHIISCQTEGRETPPPDVRQQSIDKCQQWLVRHNPR